MIYFSFVSDLIEFESEKELSNELSKLALIFALALAATLFTGVLVF